MPNPNMDLIDAIKLYKTFLIVERGLSKNTAKAYEETLMGFVEYLFPYYCFKVKDVTPKQIVRFTSESRAGNKDYQANTLARKRSIIRSFFSYCVYDELLEAKSNPGQNIENIQAPYRKLPNIISIEEAISIIEHASEMPNSLIFELLYATGIRVSELVNINLEDVRLSEMYIKVCSGKGMKDRLVPIHQICADKMMTYLEIRKNIRPSNPKNSKRLFLQANGKHYTRQRIHQIITEAAKAVHITKKVTPHTFRHSFATHLYNNGVDILSLRDLLGHSCVNTTEIYVHVSTDNLRKQLMKYHPRFC